MNQMKLAFVALLLVTGSAEAFEATGTLKRIDPDKSIIQMFANGQDRTVRLDKDVKVEDKDGKPLANGLKSAELKDGATITVTLERGDGGPIIKAIRVGGSLQPKDGGGKPSVGLKPLTEMAADERYKGEDGGLYGGGKNDPPAEHQALAAKESAKIVPLDPVGKPSDKGTIGLVSISMSNATQEFSFFKQIADADPKKSRQVNIVDCAQGGQAMAQWVDPQARSWEEARRRLQAAGVSPKQVQVVWIKLANVAPSGDLSEHGRKLQKDTLAVIQNAKKEFPNLRIAYLSSRIYGGYSGGRLNPEPYAYEGAFAVRWLIQDQIKGDKDYSLDKAPVLLWGPYFWADGTTPRKGDKLVWERSDLASDGTHPSQSGREKVAKILLDFFKTDALAKTWFLAK